VRRLLVKANVVPSSMILVTLMMEELGSSETSVLTRATRRNIPEDGILQTITPVSAFLTLAQVWFNVPVLLGNRRTIDQEYRTCYWTVLLSWIQMGDGGNFEFSLCFPVLLTHKQTQWLLVRQRTIMTDRPPLPTFSRRGCCVISVANPLDR
jgi:hypothetical protein